MRDFTRKLATLFIALSVIMAGGMALAGSAAAETTTLAGDGTDEVPGFTASDSDHLETSVDADGTDFETDGSETLHLNVSYDGETYATLETNVSDGTSASQTLNLSHAELSDLPGDAGQATTVEVTTWGEDADGNVSTPETSFNADITFDSSYAATTVNDDSATIEEADVGMFGSLSASVSSLWSSSSDDPADLHTYDQTVGVNGNSTSVTVTDATTNGSDAFTDAMGEELESGDLITGASAGVDGTPVLAFYDEADTDMVSDGDTYAVYDSDAGTWTFELGDDYSDAEEVDVYVSSQSYTAGDTFESADLGSLFVDSASMSSTSLFSNFGVLDTFSSFSFGDLLPF